MAKKNVFAFVTIYILYLLLQMDADLYADLDTSKCGLKNADIGKKYEILVKDLEEMKGKCGELQYANAELKKQNEHFEKVIGTLYSTALNELSRKNKIIQQLQKR